MSFLGATSSPVLDFWWHLIWVSKPEDILPYSLLCRGKCNVHSPRSTSSATCADLLVAGSTVGHFPTYISRGGTCLRFEQAITRTEKECATIVPATLLLAETYHSYLTSDWLRGAKITRFVISWGSHMVWLVWSGTWHTFSAALHPLANRRLGNTFLKKVFGGHVSFFGATGTPVLDFWWCLPWVSKPEWVLPYSLFVEANVMYIAWDPPLVLHEPTSWRPVHSQSLPHMHVQKMNVLPLCQRRGNTDFVALRGAEEGAWPIKFAKFQMC